LAYLVVFPRWGWRPLFFLGGLPALLALYVRTQVEESEVWRQTRHPTWAALGRGIASHWGLFVYLTLLMTMMNLVSHGTQDMYPTFLERQWGFGPQARAAVTAFSMVGAIAGGVFFGALSERIGRRRAIVVALVGALAVVPLWAFAPRPALLVTGAFVIQLMVQGAWGVIPVHINELSPDSLRGFLPGFAYQCGVLLAGSVAYVEALLAERTSYATAMASVAGLVLSVAVVVVMLGRERRGMRFGS
jgi:SHS family lactate transporter-like MFS transporter